MGSSFSSVYITMTYAVNTVT